MTIKRVQKWDQEEIALVRISMAPPLRWVNSYVLRGDEGITIIDPGPHTNVSEGEWREAFAELGISAADISAIVITHHHPDHYGMAGYMQSLSGAPVFMSERAHEETRRMWGAASTMNEELLNLYSRNGLPEAWCEQLPAHMESFISQVTPVPEVTYLSEESRFRMGGRIWLPIETGGHAPGHLSFYHTEQKIMICGDAVLPQISPNVSFLPGSDPMPLHTFMVSLDKLSAYEVDIAFPGHRNPFIYFGERTRLLIKHHEERLERIVNMLAEQAMTGYEVCAVLFGNELGIHQMRFAMSETLAHVIELIRLGQVQISDGSDRQTDVFKLV
ncbi:putative metallo-hydrolase YflN [compost metagenome]